MSYSTILQSVGPNKIQVIKLVRQCTHLGLREALELVNRAPTLLKAEMSKREAQDIQNDLFKVGATVQIVNNDKQSRTRQKRRRLLFRLGS